MTNPPVKGRSNRDEWSLVMDVDISTVTRQSARSRTDAHADGSTFVPRKATISGFATNPTRTFFANARKADRNHGFTSLSRSVGMKSCAQISFYDRRISLYDRTHTAALLIRIFKTVPAC